MFPDEVPGPNYVHPDYAEYADMLLDYMRLGRWSVVVALRVKGQQVWTRGGVDPLGHTQEIVHLRIERIVQPKAAYVGRPYRWEWKAWVSDRNSIWCTGPAEMWLMPLSEWYRSKEYASD